MEGDRRAETRTIRADAANIAEQLRAMKRLWAEQGPID